MTTPPGKAALREQFRSYRSSLSTSTHHRLSREVTRRARTLPELQRARTVHVYWPLLDRGEIDTRPLIRWLQDGGRRIVLPRVVPTEQDAPPSMEHVAFTEEADLQRNGWGVAEPSGTEHVALDELDAVIVPAFGAGRNGHRIGHGLGYYDAFLLDLDVARICLTYHATLVPQVPAEKHDVAMTHVVTEREVVRLGSGTG